MSSVDVIVPCYGYGHFLEKCVASVLAQSGPSVRVLVIDDASPDNTKDISTELAKRDRRVTVLFHSSNLGHIATYNEGIEWASAEYLLLLSADDYLLPGALGRAVHVFEAHPDVGMVMGKAIELFDGNELPKVNEGAPSERRPDYRIMSSRKFIEFSGCRNRVPTPTAVVRTKLQKQLGGYRPELPHTGDMEMWLRFAAHGCIGILDEYQAVYRRHSRNMTASYTKQFWLPELEQRKAALNWFFVTCGYMFPDRHLPARLLRLLSLDAISCASAAFNEGEIETSEQIQTFAMELCPEVRRSWRWMKLACKRFVGFRAWCAMHPLHSAPVADREDRIVAKAGFHDSRD
jgi:glycosyltransferase involved in cell wall biosynthesis